MRVVNKEVPRELMRSERGSERESRKERECQEACVGDHERWSFVSVVQWGRERGREPRRMADGVYILGARSRSAPKLHSVIETYLANTSRSMSSSLPQHRHSLAAFGRSSYAPSGSVPFSRSSRSQIPAVHTACNQRQLWIQQADVFRSVLQRCSYACEPPTRRVQALATEGSEGELCSSHHTNIETSGPDVSTRSWNQTGCNIRLA